MITLLATDTPLAAELPVDTAGTVGARSGTPCCTPTSGERCCHGIRAVLCATCREYVTDTPTGSPAFRVVPFPELLRRADRQVHVAHCAYMEARRQYTEAAAAFSGRNPRDPDATVLDEAAAAYKRAGTRLDEAFVARARLVDQHISESVHDAIAQLVRSAVASTPAQEG